MGDGDEVLVPGNTYAATAFAISYCGAKPVMVDVDPSTYNIDPDAAAAAITERTRAILPVHLYGHPDALREWLSERGVATSVFYPTPLHLQDAYKDLGYAKGQFPVSEHAAEDTLALPVFPGYSSSMIEYVAEMVRSFFGR